MSVILNFAVGLLALYLLKTLVLSRKPSPKIPPGPPRKPIIGNLHDLPSHVDRDWEHWLKHKDLYGPISSLTIGGQNLIILNDARLAMELLEKRSSIHSSRPSMNFAKLAGWNYVLGAVQYSDAFRASRKALHQQIGSNVSVSRFNAVQQAEVGRFLLRVLEAPQDLVQHIRKQAGAIVLKVGYGYTVEPHVRDPLIDLADRAMEEFSVAILPGTWAVDFVPFLKHLPTWLPGAGFVRLAKSFRNNVAAFSDVPYEFVKRKMQAQDLDCPPSFLSNLLRENTSVIPGSEEENNIKWSAASLYAGGADTTVSTISSLYLAMALFPSVQRKAQAEIDAVVGSSRLPGFHDRENLPYINAMVKEVLRWHPVVPMGVAHMSMQDDVCEGFDIPAGSTILSNIWAFTHDPAIYHDPMEFKPERFLATPTHTPERDPHLLSFGFGRRVCPGRTLADANVYLGLVQSLAVFEISKAVRADGTRAELEPEFLPGVISHPAPFEISIKARGEEQERLVRGVEKEWPWEESQAKELGIESYPQ